jgi:hypothetical protein
MAVTDHHGVAFADYVPELHPKKRIPRESLWHRNSGS